MDSLPRSRSLRRLYSNSSNNTLQTRGSLSHLLGKAGQQSSTTGGGNHGPLASPSLPAAAELHPALVHNFRKAGQNLTDAAAQAEWANKKWVWVPDATLGYVAGWIVSEENDMAQVACVDDKVGAVYCCLFA
jgi:hypothetical protein